MNTRKKKQLHKNFSKSKKDIHFRYSYTNFNVLTGIDNYRLSPFLQTGLINRKFT
uniref:Uncharacterized protein n=1 Tax=Meloidogyne enterolobii TaxID=390850 RepID=A0A6V7VP73_MELEN|nr:unnamed protein product [Meloidogyne enterolobii]